MEVESCNFTFKTSFKGFFEWFSEEKVELGFWEVSWAVRTFIVSSRAMTSFLISSTSSWQLQVWHMVESLKMVYPPFPSIRIRLKSEI